MTQLELPLNDGKKRWEYSYRTYRGSKLGQVTNYLALELTWSEAHKVIADMNESFPDQDRKLTGNWVGR